MKTIQIIVSPKGDTRVETKGYAGSECRGASRFVEEALGQRTGEQITSEFYQPQSIEEQARQRH